MGVVVAVTFVLQQQSDFISRPNNSFVSSSRNASQEKLKKKLSFWLFVYAIKNILATCSYLNCKYSAAMLPNTSNGLCNPEKTPRLKFCCLCLQITMDIIELHLRSAISKDNNKDWSAFWFHLQEKRILDASKPEKLVKTSVHIWLHVLRTHTLA